MDEVWQNQCFPNDIQTTIDGLRRKFLDGLDTRIVNIETALNEGNKSDWKIPAAKFLIVATHSIAGLAPCLGFTPLGQTASRAEFLWEQTVKQGCAEKPRNTAIRATNMLLDEMEALLEPVPATSICSG